MQEQKNKLRFAYFIPHDNTIYAGRTILNGYRNAIKDLGHDFLLITSESNQKLELDAFQPNLLITGLSPYILKYLDVKLLKKQKKAGMKVLVSIPLWNSPFSKKRINETASLSSNDKLIDLIKSGIGDIYFNICEQGDHRMNGFEKVTGYHHYTIPLAADKLTIFPDYSEKFKADISYIGTNLPGKRQFMNDWVFPLNNNYDLRLYGQDWTTKDKFLGIIQKGGQYFNIPILQSIQKPKLELNDERKIYTSSTISINIHENYQKEMGGDCNERTFKIPLAGGFEITDDVSCIQKYFVNEKEIVIAKNKEDWFDKIDYYINNPDKRNEIIEAGKKKVLEKHTYHNRVNKLIDIYRKL